MSERGEWGDAWAIGQIFGAIIVLVLLFVLWATGALERAQKSNDAACAKIGAKYYERQLCIKPDSSIWKMPEIK